MGRKGDTQEILQDIQFLLKMVYTQNRIRLRTGNR